MLSYLSMHVNRNRIIVVIVIVLVGLFFFNARRQKTTNKTESTRVARGTLKETLSLSGTLDADQRVVLRFQTAGRLSYIGVKKGDYVKKYQLIASLDQRSVRENLQKVLNNYLTTRWSFEQTKDDNKDKVLTDTIRRTLDQSQFSLNNAVLDVQLQQLSIEYSSLTTPFEGIVTAVTSPYTGVNIVPTQAEFEVVNPKTIFFSANADQTEVTQLKEGMEGDLVLDSYSDKSIHGTIANIAYIPTTGETGTVYAIKFVLSTINNKDYQYRIGMTGDATFTIKSKDNALYLPIRFVAEEEGKKYVFVIDHGKKIKKHVLTGIETDNNIEITSGLSEGDVVYD